MYYVMWIHFYILLLLLYSIMFIDNFMFISNINNNINIIIYIVKMYWYHIYVENISSYIECSRKLIKRGSIDYV